MSSLELGTSERGCEVLYVNKFKFNLNKVRKCGRKKWFCEKRRVLKCTAMCYTEGEIPVLMQNDLAHNHELNVKKYTRQTVSNSCKRKAEEDLFERPEKIIRMELVENESRDFLTERDIDYIRRNMYNARRNTLPPLPKDIEGSQDVLADMNLSTDRGENFLLHNDRENKIVIFGCETNVTALKKSNRLLMDGTFSYCCNFFKQLFTIFMVENSHYVPLLFCLLPDKKQSTYKCLFERVKLMLGDDTIEEIVVDFEVSLHNAVRRVWPTVQILGCRFHLTQSWYRKIQNLSLVNIYKNKGNKYTDDSKWLKGLFGLPYLSPEEVSPCFVEDFMSKLPKNPTIVKFADYLVENYINEASLFPPKMWASFTKKTVTNNPCESFHSHFQKKFYKSHPNVFMFTKQLINTQTFVYVKLNSILDEPKVTGNSLFKRGQEMLEKAKEDYLAGSISREKYVMSVSVRNLK